MAHKAGAEVPPEGEVIGHPSGFEAGAVFYHIIVATEAVANRFSQGRYHLLYPVYHTTLSGPDSCLIF